MSVDPISVQDLRKRYGRGKRAVDALQGVSLAVRPGEIYGLLGRNGAGKTTLVKILLDIVRPDAGEARLLGRSSRSTAARLSVGYLPEDHRFPEYRTGAGALDFYGALSRCDRSTRARRARELLELVGLEKDADRKLRAYSKGMKQRLALAQALMDDPRVLFLDEPTDGVDPVGRAQIRDLLLKLKAAGKTIFLNSHLLSETERVCDRVGILDRGRLVREGTIAELTRREIAFAIETDRAPDEALLARLAAIAMRVERAPGSIEVAVERVDHIDGVVDALRAHGIGIRAVVPKRHTLEEVFLDLVEGEETRGAEGGEA